MNITVKSTTRGGSHVDNRSLIYNSPPPHDRMGGGSKHGFAFGFPVGCLHYQKGFVGDCKITYVMDGW